ncbi:uncharacterized protein KD926_009600 [Aspergillus affinis]|uniref:uncharacterized protein n=1 Tax=Aspergillus affinis TaxID=1070780 RepID=UPI0022FE83A8|nr:uncharacterized protein KD926_009600 [Aspergillus affinis]KAI9045186.1 hypothetical protein KD926_009600 [Aspergillus affinis]
MTGLTIDPGTNSVWRVDHRNVSKDSVSNETSPMAEVTLVAALEKAGTLNGMCQLGQSDHMLIMADSADGTIWNLDVNTGLHEIVINQPILKHIPQGLQFGVDGVHTHDSDLFFTNFNQGLFAKIPVSPIWGNATGPAELIVNGTAGDDFVLSPDGTVDIAMKSSRVIAESSALSEAASVTIGRTKWDRNSLYVASGGVVNPRGNGTRSEGIVARIDLPNAI